ncbi:MAG TPA: hypothetical protein PKD18_19830 [Saprospiraceae bacterium]|nr:hypothetical protein [Saprospiraceae bacterium]
MIIDLDELKINDMLGIVLMYLVGREYYKLAILNQKNAWLYAIVGVVSYYVGVFLGGILVVILYHFISEEAVEEMSELKLEIMAIPFGVLSCYLFYRFLKFTWSKKYAKKDEDILDELL